MNERNIAYIAHAHLNSSEYPKIIFGKISKDINIQLHGCLYQLQVTNNYHEQVYTPL